MGSAAFFVDLAMVAILLETIYSGAEGPLAELHADRTRPVIIYGHSLRTSCRGSGFGFLLGRGGEEGTRACSDVSEI